MQEAKDPKSTGTAGGGDDAANVTREPGSDATSSDTLSDVEGKEKVTGTVSGEGSGQSEAPSPDGAFDEGGSRGPGEDPGPM